MVVVSCFGAAIGAGVLRKVATPAAAASVVQRGLSMFAAAGSTARPSTLRRLQSTSAVNPEQPFVLLRFLDEDGLEQLGMAQMDNLTYASTANGDKKVVKILAPLQPTALYAIGLNYRDHARETGFELPKAPVVIMKAATSVIAPGAEIVIPKVASEKPEVDYEGELAIVLDSPCKNVSVEQAMSHVLGFTIANDVTARRWQGKKGGNQWVRAKSFDTFCPLGPVIVPPMFFHAADAKIQTRVNGKLMQDSSTNNMVFSPAEIISFLSQDTTLPSGTVILTGTPAGVGYVREPPAFLAAGDTVSVSIEGIGELTNTVVGPRD